MRRFLPAAVVTAVCTAFASTPVAAADGDTRWGVTLWGVSYHVDKSIDYDEENWGAGLRRYFAHRVFVEGDALRNSNRGLVLPASVGIELGAATLFGACKASAVAALTAAYYQNARTGSDDFKVGPVPGVAVRCGRIQPNVVAVFGKSRGLVALVGAVTIHF
jgi:hypothetical protein